MFKISHDIPICESVSPNSSYRWHSMDEAQYEAYLQRLENEICEFMDEAEAKQGKELLGFSGRVRKRIRYVLPLLGLRGFYSEICFRGCSSAILEYEVPGVSMDALLRLFRLPGAAFGWQGRLKLWATVWGLGLGLK